MKNRKAAIRINSKSTLSANATWNNQDDSLGRFPPKLSVDLLCGFGRAIVWLAGGASRVDSWRVVFKSEAEFAT